MDTRKILLTFLLTAATVWTAVAQTIGGTVVDSESGEGIMGATVKYGDAKGVITDIDGNFSIVVKKLPVQLTITYTGYISQTLTVYDDEEEISVKLAEKRNILDDIVVVGYGTMKRTQLTGSVVSIKADVFENNISATLDGALSGQVAGLNVTASSGQPGASSEIRIRGGNSIYASNEPLYVIDGFIYYKDAANNSTGIGAIESSMNPLAILNPNDIESIEVLKDIASTAIFGSRGSNGVIIVTTKKGEIGKKRNEITYGYNIGASRIAKKLDLMTASEWAQMQKTYFGNKGGYSDAEIAALGKGTDWQEAMLRTALQQSHQLSVTGATESSRYTFSANYTDQQGIILNSGYSRYNFHSNVEWEIRKGLDFGFNFNYGRSKQSGLSTTESTKGNSSPFSAGITNSFVYALLMPPVESVYNADGSYNFSNNYEYAYFAIGDHSANPVYDVKESVADNYVNNLLLNVWTTYKFKFLTFKAAVGTNSEKLTQEFFADPYTALGLANEGIGGVGNRQTDTWQQEYTISWNKDLNDNHHFDGVVGTTFEKVRTSYNTTITNHYSTWPLKQYRLANGKNVYTPANGMEQASLISHIARFNYSLLNRYNLTGTLRFDKSDRFAEGHQWDFFPSLGLSWNVEKEAFLADVHQLDYLKLRVSEGLVGNQEIDYNAAKTNYNSGTYGGASSYVKTNTRNDNLKWEKTRSLNLGIDIGLYSSKINLSADVYYKKTSDLLLSVPAGLSTGVSTQLQNVGNVENRGVEFEVNGTLLKRRRLTWTASANIAINHNEMTELGKNAAGIDFGDQIQGSDKQYILREGEAYLSYYGLKFLGIVQTGEDVSKLPTINGQTPKPGDLKYEDANGDNMINGNDCQILGCYQPKFTYGFSTQANYRWFDLSLSFAGSYGNKLYNALGRRLEQTGDSYNVLRTVLNSWTPENGGNTLALANTTRPFSFIDSRYVQDASYLKLKNLTLGYTPRLPKGAPVRLRVYVTASNLLTISPYKGYDPEVAGGTDSGAYPSARTLTFGASVTL